MQKCSILQEDFQTFKKSITQSGFATFQQNHLERRRCTIATGANAVPLKELNKKLPLKFLVVGKEQSRLVLSNCKVVAISKAHIGIGAVVTGIVPGLKPYGAFIDIGGPSVHVSQISDNCVSDVATVLQPDRLKMRWLGLSGRGLLEQQQWCMQRFQPENSFLNVFSRLKVVSVKDDKLKL
ncbi:hypothetical protein COCNU_01G000660 [Cocos nucifera]|uniref:S1 motif domain-containing protein n=1 Tax=Cocos nucifera TaxID=13894 RepID=A0A8K0HSB5_COCNU|nr:hypothetical protein COCNU_01G000660 [Cocos nucifera]